MKAKGGLQKKELVLVYFKNTKIGNLGEECDYTTLYKKKKKETDKELDHPTQVECVVFV